MRTGESSKYQLAAIRLTRMHFHICIFFVSFYDFRHVAEVQFGVNTVREQVHCQCDNINVTSSFTVAEQCAFDTVTACQQTQFRIGYGSAAVVVGVQRKDYVFTVVQVFGHISNLRCVNMQA